jgi:hypothetical protein
VDPGLNKSASAHMAVPGHGWMRFPVRGTRLRHAVMTAVDESGVRIARYRKAKRTRDWGLAAARAKTMAASDMEILVNPTWRLTDQQLLVIVMSASYLRSHFYSLEHERPRA